MQMPPDLPAFNPYAAPAARLDDTAASTRVLHLAPRGSRLAATILDSLAVGLIFGLVVLVEAAFGQRQDAKTLRIALWVVAGLAGIGLIAANWFMLHRNGQTLGKHLLHIKVVKPDGSRVELWRFIFLRYVPISLLGAIPGLGAFISLLDSVMIFGEQQRCLHDHMANTIVITV